MGDVAESFQSAWAPLHSERQDVTGRSSLGGSVLVPCSSAEAVLVVAHEKSLTNGPRKLFAIAVILPVS